MPVSMLGHEGAEVEAEVEAVDFGSGLRGMCLNVSVFRRGGALSSEGRAWGIGGNGAFLRGGLGKPSGRANGQGGDAMVS